MKPVSITLNHCFRYGSERNVFNFDKPLTLIMGSNGAGKSSIFESICYALFGYTIRFGATFSDIVRRGKDWGGATFVFEKDGATYEVERTWSNKLNSTTVRFRCITTGQDLTTKTTKQTNEDIEKLVGLNFETFRNSVLFGQFDFKRIVSLGPSERLDLVADLLSLQYIKKCSDVASTRKLTVDSSIEELRAKLEEKDPKKIRKEIRSAKELLEMMEEEAQEQRQKFDTKKSRIQKFKQLKDRFVSARSAYKNANVFIEEQQERVDRLKKKTSNKRISLLQKLEKKYSHAKEQYDRLTGLDNELDEVEEKCFEIQETITELKTERRLLRSRIKQIKSKKKCSECGRPYDENVRGKLTKKPLQSVKTIDKKMELENKQLEEKKKEIKEIKQEIGKIKNIEDPRVLKEKIISLKAAKDFETEIQSIQKEIDRRKETARRAKLAMDEIKQTGYTEDKIDSLESQLLKLKGQIEAKKTEISQLKKNISKQKQELKKIKAKQDKIEDLKEKGRLYSFLTGMFSKSGGLKQALVENILPRLNLKVNGYLESLTDESIAVNFTTSGKTKSGSLRNKLDIQIITPRGEAKFESYSGGEKQTIVLAIGLGFAELASESSGISCEFLFLDEVFASLDEKARQRLIRLLYDLKTKFKTIVLVSHLKELHAQLPDVVRIRKKKGISRIICV